MTITFPVNRPYSSKCSRFGRAVIRSCDFPFRPPQKGSVFAHRAVRATIDVPTFPGCVLRHQLWQPRDFVLVHPSASVEPRRRMCPRLPVRLVLHVASDSGQNFVGSRAFFCFGVGLLRFQLAHALWVLFPEPIEIRIRSLFHLLATFRDTPTFGLTSTFATVKGLLSYT